MIPSLRAMDVTEAAMRFAARRGEGDWLVLVVQSVNDVRAIADEFAEALETAGSIGNSRIVEARTAEELATRMASVQGALVISGLDAWESSEWAHLDHLRSRFARHERTALVIEERTFQRIVQEAPNFSSWLGANVVKCQKILPILTTEERERRLEALRTWAQLSDAEIIARAEANVLPPDPEFAEWLVLLHRGDLLHG